MKITTSHLLQAMSYAIDSYAMTDARVPSTAKEAILYGYSKSFVCDAFGLTEEAYWLERNIALYTPIPLTGDELKSIYAVKIEPEPKKDNAPWRGIPHKRGRTKRNRR